MPDFHSDDKPARDLSRAAADAIDKRTRAARPHIWSELTALIRHRGGAITEQQIKIAASVLSYIIAADELEASLGAWLAVDVRASQDVAAAWLASTEWRDVLARAEAAAGGRQRAWRPRGAAEPRLRDPRRHYSISTIRDEFRITDDEAEALNFKHLISERRRSALRRAAEHVDQQPDASPTPSAETTRPWEAAGLSRSAWYARQARTRREAVAAAVRRAAGEPELDKAPWIAAGVSKATWYRRKKAGETKNRTPVDPIKEPTYNTFLDTVARSPDSSLTSATPPASAFPTAEARRLRALALRLGLAWIGGKWREPELCWKVPPGRTLTTSEAADLEAAMMAARHAEWRREAIEAERMREAAAVEMATTTPAERQAAREAAEAELRAATERGDRPARVSEAAWAAVPADLRPRVTKFAGRFFLYGHEPDAAVALGVEAIRREDAIVAAVLRQDPDADIERVRRAASKWYRHPTAEAAAHVRADLSREEGAEAQSCQNQEQQVRRYASLEYPDLSSDARAALIAAALDVLAQPGENDPYRAVRIAGARRG